MAEELTRDERDARLVLDSVLTPRARGLVEQRRREGFTDRAIATWLGDTRQRGLESGRSPEELDAFLFKPDLSATTRRFMATVAEGLTGGFAAETRTGDTRPGSFAAEPRPPLESRGAPLAAPDPSRSSGPGVGTALAALAGIAALTKGRGAVRAYRALPPETQARITQMAAGAIGAGMFGMAYKLRNEDRLWPRR